jgi:putative membrane protein
VEEKPMFSLRSLILAGALLLSGATLAQTTVLKDSWIVRIADAARDADISAADMAISKAASAAVKSFAEQIKRDHTTEKAAARESFNQLGLKPEDNELSQSLTDVGAEQSKELAGLSGSAFDKAYLQNEVAYNVFVIGVLEVTAIPSIKNSVLKRLVESRLENFKAHKKTAEALLNSLK